MHVRTQQYLGACISAAIVLVIGATLIVASQRVSRAVDRGNFATDIFTGISELRFVMFEYILHHHERPRLQWQQRHDTLTELLAGDTFDGTDQQQIVNVLRQHHQDLKKTFSRLTDNYTPAENGPAETALSRELEARLTGQLLAISQEMITVTFRLLQASESEVANTQRWASALVMLAIVLMGFIVVANAVLSIRYLLKPIGQLQRGIEIIGKGDLSHRIGIRSSNEIGALSGMFDRMTERLQVSRAALEEKTAQLVDANKELESFSYSVAHDLRAPLRAIDGFGQRLIETAKDKLDPAAVHYLDRIRAGTQVMAQLIEDMLNLSRISRAKLLMQPVDISTLVQRIANELQKSAPQRVVEWVIADEAGAQGDERLLEIMFRNLLGNAWKFASKRDHARIEFGVTRQDGDTVYFVRDNGAGFDMAYADKLFEPFQRLHSAAEFPGTGIGLVTVRRILQRHGGRIWAQAAMGEGAAFFFTFGKGAEHGSKTDTAG